MLSRLKLQNYRNIDSIELEFDPKLNIFYGDNAQGKTNIVESIGFISLLKSFRNCEINSLIKDDKEFASIEAIDDKNDLYKVIITNDKKSLSINKTNIKKKSDFIGCIPSITFTPENVDMFKDSPKIRRDFLDDILTLAHPSYESYLINYEKYRLERNTILKDINPNKTLIETYNGLLSSYAKVIVSRRKYFIENIETNLKLNYQNLSNSKDIISISYLSDFINDDEITINKKYYDNLKADLERKQTLLGPHKDDLKLFLNSKDISEYGSQGQNRLAVISLKIATLDYIKQVTNKNSIVILDDVLSELDDTKQTRLLNYLNTNYQLFITTTKKLNITQGKIFKIEQGKIGGNLNG